MGEQPKKPRATTPDGQYLQGNGDWFGDDNRAQPPATTGSKKKPEKIDPYNDNDNWSELGIKPNVPQKEIDNCIAEAAKWRKRGFDTDDQACHINGTFSMPYAPTPVEQGKKKGGNTPGGH